MYYTKSLNKVAYISYCTDVVGDVVEDKNGMYGFEFEDNEEVKRVVDEYNKCVSLQDRLCVDLIEYNKIIFHYKSLVKYYKINKVCDKVIENMEN